MIFVGMTSFAAVGFFAAFEEVEDFFEAADLESFGVACGGESGFDEFFGGSAGGAFEIAEDDAVAFFGDEVPVQSFGVVEIPGEFLLLFGRECSGEFCGGGGHGDTGGIGAIIGGAGGVCGGSCGDE